MKYIMVEINFGTTKARWPFIFPNNIVHSIIYEHISNCLKVHNIQNFNLHSAGECHVYDTECSGKSETLKVKSNDFEDAVIINQFDYFHGII